MSAASSKEDLSMTKKTVGRATCCFVKEKLRFSGLPDFVPCLQLFGAMAQLSLERLEVIPVQGSP